MEEKAVQLRRCEDTLYVSGTVLILFGLWSLIKITLEVVFYKEMMADIINSMQGAADDQADHFIGSLTYVLMYTAIAVDLLIRFYLGSRARRDGRGENAGRLYVGAAVLVCIISGGDTIRYILDSFRAGGGLFSTLVNCFVEFTSFLVYLSTAAAALKVKQLRRTLKGEV